LPFDPTPPAGAFSGHADSEWAQNVEVGQLPGQATEKAVNSVNLAAFSKKGLLIANSKPL
jgi:hypothetical protein